MIGLFAVGTVGFHIVGGPQYTWLDAAYMTAITLTTVGFSETIDLSNNPVGRMFTLALLIGGVGAFIYFFSQLMGFIVEGSLDHMFLRIRMNKQLDRMRDHYIVCGAGHTGVHVIDELVRTNRPVVLIERVEESATAIYDEHGGKVPFVLGDAAEDENLVAAGVERAAGVITCFSNDKDNLIVVFSARAMNPKLRIVCRCVDEKVKRKMELAGADAVVSPNTIGGLRMVSELVRPKAVTFLDAMLRERDDHVRVEDVRVAEGSRLDGLTLRDLRGEQVQDVLIVAVHFPDDRWHFNPDGTTRLTAGTSMVFIAAPETRARLELLAAQP